jgi:hypothetical protein
MRSNLLLDNDLVSWVVEEVLGRHTCPKMRELGFHENEAK